MKLRHFAPTVLLLITILLTFPIEYGFTQDILAEADFSLKDVKSLEVEGGFCNVELKGSSGSSLTMNARIEGNDNPDKYEIVYRVDNGRIKVWIERPNSSWRNIKGWMKFDVPKHIDVKIDNSSGNIQAEDLESNEIYLEASSGNITAENLKGLLNLKCSSGNITLEGQDGRTTARASSGNLRIEEVTGDLNAHASSGNITISDIRGDIEADCSSGNIRLSDTEGRLTIGTSSGNIRGEGILLTGDSRFKASSGGVTIELKNSKEDLSFDLDTGSGNLYAAGSSADDKLILKRGPITISGITTSGNQRYSVD